MSKPTFPSPAIVKIKSFILMPRNLRVIILRETAEFYHIRYEETLGNIVAGKLDRVSKKNLTIL
jgi:hypothetical protein